MMKFLRLIAGTVLVIGLVLVFSVITMTSADAASPAESACVGSGGTWTPDTDGGGVCKTGTDNRTVTSTLRQVADILIFIVGAIAVIMLIIGGVRYTVSQGDQAATASAKNTILYALVGVVVAVSAYGLVNFITSQFK